MRQLRTPKAFPETAPLFVLVQQSRQLLRSSWLATGLGLSLGLLLTTLTASALVDILLPLPIALRFLAFLVVVVPALWAFLTGVVRPALRPMTPNFVARRIEAEIPGMHNRLVSCIDLATRGAQARHSPLFFHKLVDEARERLRGFRPKTLVHIDNLFRAAIFGGGGLAALLLLLGFFFHGAPTALARILSPFADIPPCGDVEYTIEPGTAQLLRGEDIPFLVHVVRGTPERIWLQLYSDQGATPLTYDLQQDEDQWKLTLSGTLPTGFENGFTYRVYGGGTWSKLQRITLVERPRLVELHTVLHFPKYMDLPPRVDPPQTTEIVGPEASQVEVVVQTEGQVQEADIQLLEPRRRKSATKERPDRVWFSENLPAGAQTEGTWKWDGAAHTEPPAAGMHSHTFHGVSFGFPVSAGETLFTYVYLDPEHLPEAIMLQWHDGSGWEHRAYWGSDVIGLGQPNTPSHRRLGPLPAAGKWVRLEVPAEVVDLAGRELHGMSFVLAGGKASWGRSGVEELDLVPVKSFPLKQAGDAEWSGQFPLMGEGYYRVELRNSLSHPSKPMKEARYTAIPDNPPQIVLERPGTQLVLSEPLKVPVVVSAFDDFGLARIDLVLKRRDSPAAAWETRVLKTYAKPQRNDNIVSALDLPALKVPAGDTLHFRLEARDRKGQIAKTPDCTIRIVPADPAAADKRLEDFDKSQEQLRDKLSALVGQQIQVREALDKLAVKYKPLLEKVEAARAETRPAPEGTPQAPDAKDPPQALLKLDPDSAQQLEQMQKELGPVAQQEQQAAEAGKQLDAEMEKSNQQAASLQMVPQQVLQQMQATQRLFQQAGVQPMQNLAGEMARGADPQQAPPDMNAMRQQAERVQKDLESMRGRLEALDKARKGLRGNLDQALAKLREEMQREDAGMTRELEELRQYIDKLMDELKKAEGQEQVLQGETDRARDSALPDLEAKQGELEKDMGGLLQKTKDLQASDKMKRMKRSSDSPDAQGEQAEQSGAETPDDPGKDNPEDGDAPFTPALNGPKPKMDANPAGKHHSGEKPHGGKADPQGMRQDLKDREAEQIQNAEAAQESLRSDEMALERMKQQLEQAAKGGRSPKRPGQDPSGEKDQDLRQMMQAPELQQALAMAGRMRQQRSGQGAPQKPSSSTQPGQAQAPPKPGPSTPNLQGPSPLAAAQEAELAKLDPAMRTVIMKMPPQVREELLQGMREEGPEGYRRFIQEYFKRLTEIKK